MSALEILGIDNYLVGAADFEAGRRFYAETLGLRLKFDVPQQGLAGFRLGAEEPGLFLRRGEATARLWLEVADARKAAEELRERGVELLGDPFELQTGWAVELADPAGNVVGLTDYTKRPDLARRPAPSS
jgi:predicted enzyme related to lactoylglutathione lyase